MKKEIRTVDTKRGIVQVTTSDERWYIRSTTDPTTGLPQHAFVPSVTWIAEYYPKGIGFYKWLAQTGWDEAQALKEAAGDKGSKVHTAIAMLLSGQTITLDEAVLNPSTGQAEPLTLEEYQAVMSFAAWHRESRPTLVAADLVIWNDTEGYAGTVDYACTLGGQLYVVDFKTSKNLYPSHRMQVSAYKAAMPAWKDAKLAILQLGYERNRLGYKFTEVEDCFDLFLAAKRIWREETQGQQPWQRDYPLSIALAQPQEGAGCAPSEADARTTNGSRLTSGLPERSRKSNTTKTASTT